MTKFNKEDILLTAMGITDQADADQYKAAYIDFVVQENKGMWRHEAERIVNSNLGYFAGYGDAALRARVEKLFKCSHPVFGSIEQNGQPTDQEAYDAGIGHGRNI